MAFIGRVTDLSVASDRVEAKRREYAKALFDADDESRQLFDAPRSQMDDGRSDLRRVNVNRVRGRRAARDLADERDRAILRAPHALVVNAALEAVGRFGL